MGTMLSDCEHLGYGADGERRMEDTLEHLHMKPHERERVIVICDPSESQSDKWQSVLLIGMLNDIAGKSARGIVDFDTYADAGDRYEDWVVYDKSNGKVVCDALVDELHRDIVCYYESIFPDVEIRVIDDGEDECGLFVEVDFGGACIVVEDGRWYVASF